MKVYIVGSLRNDTVRDVADALRDAGHDAFDQWHAAGPRADDEWKAYFHAKEASLAVALASPFVQHIVAFDKHWLTWADAVVVVFPAGVSAHWEAQWALNQGKRVIMYMPEELERWDAMYALTPELLFASTIDDVDALLRM